MIGCQYFYAFILVGCGTIINSSNYDYLQHNFYWIITKHWWSNTSFYSRLYLLTTDQLDPIYRVYRVMKFVFLLESIFYSPFKMYLCDSNSRRTCRFFCIRILIVRVLIVKLLPPLCYFIPDNMSCLFSRWIILFNQAV